MEQLKARKTGCYLIGRISRENQPLLEKIAGRLDERIEIFIPHKHNPFDRHPWMPPHAALRDLAEILFSDVGIAVVPFGRDSSWEIGYYGGLKKPILVYVDSLRDWLSAPSGYRNSEDWMVKISPVRYVTPDAETADILTRDRLCIGRTTLLDATTTLSEVLRAKANIVEEDADMQQKVLIVDDDPEFCSSLGRLVKTTAQIVFAHSFEEAVLAYKRYGDRICCIIQDETLDDRDDALKAAEQFDNLSSTVLATFFRYHHFANPLFLVGESNATARGMHDGSFDYYFEKNRQLLALLEKINATV